MNADAHEQAGRLLECARLAYDACLYDTALARLRQALTLVPALAEARLWQARVLLRQSKPRLALAALDAYDLYAPDHRQAYDVARLRIEALAGAGQLELALAEARRLIDRWPEDTTLHRIAAGLAWQLDETASASASLQRVRALEPADSTTGRLLSQLHEASNPQQGLAWLSDQPADATDVGLLLRSARLCRRAGRFRDAEARYQTLLAQHPEQTVIWSEAGQVADELGESRRAIDRLSEAIRLNGPGMAETWRRLALARLHAGQPEAAAWAWWRRTRLSPGEASAWAGLVVAAHAADRPKLIRQAKRRLAECAERADRQQALAVAWHHLAATRAGRATPGAAPSPLRGLLQRADRVLQTAAAEHPGRADAHYHHARCLKTLGSRARATVAVDQALAINPKYRDALELKATLAA